MRRRHRRKHRPRRLSTLAVSALEGSLILARVESSGEPIETLVTHDESTAAVAFSPDGKLLAAAGLGLGADRVQLWDPGTGEPIGGALRHSAQVWAVAFSSDGRLLNEGNLSWAERSLTHRMARFFSSRATRRRWRRISPKRTHTWSMAW